MDKERCLKEAIKVTEAYARGGAGTGAYDAPAEVLEKVYNKLLKLREVSTK